MSLDENKAIVRSYIEEVWNKGNVQIADQLIHQNLVNHLAPTVAPGPDGIKQSFTAFRTAFPDLETKILHLIAEGDIVVVHWVSRGTLKGATDVKGVGRINPTNKNATWSGTNIYRIADKKIAEIWANVDALQQAYQLGFIPRRPEAKAAQGRSQ